MISSVDMDIIYSRIKLLVRVRGSTLIKLSEETGISINTIKNWGRGTEASLSNLLTISNYLKVSLDYLLGSTDDPESYKSDSAKLLETLSSIRSFVDLKIAETQQKDSVPSDEEPLEPAQDKK